MAELPESDEPASNPWLGRIIALAVLLLVAMVGLGVFWVYQKAQREQAWRDHATRADPMFPGRTP